MKRRTAWIAGIVLALVAVRVYTARRARQQASGVRALDGAHLVYLVTPTRAAKLPPLGAELEVSPTGAVIMRGGDHLLALADDNGHLAVDRLDEHGAPDSFALDGSGLLSIVGRFFGQWEDDGTFSRAVPLPAPGMRLMSSTRPGTVYLFGGDDTMARRLYRLDQDGGLRILVELPTPIVAVADTPQSIYVATAGEIVRLAADGPHLVMRAPAPALTSLAVTPDERTLYYATAERVHVLKGRVALSLLTNMGGILRWRDGHLFVWDARRHLLVRVNGGA